METRKTKQELMDWFEGMEDFARRFDEFCVENQVWRLTQSNRHDIPKAEYERVIRLYHETFPEMMKEGA